MPALDCRGRSTPGLPVAVAAVAGDEKEAEMGEWVMIGVPSSAGAHHAGQERAPDALRAAGVAARLGAAGESVLDMGNLPGAKFVADREHPGGRNLPAVVQVAREVADAVADALPG